MPISWSHAPSTVISSYTSKSRTPQNDVSTYFGLYSQFRHADQGSGSGQQSTWKRLRKPLPRPQQHASLNCSANAEAYANSMRTDGRATQQNPVTWTAQTAWRRQSQRELGTCRGGSSGANAFSHQVRLRMLLRPVWDCRLGLCCWVVVKTMVPLWFLTRIRHLVFGGGPKGDHNFDNHPRSRTLGLESHSEIHCPNSLAFILNPPSVLCRRERVAVDESLCKSTVLCTYIYIYIHIHYI